MLEFKHLLIRIATPVNRAATRIRPSLSTHVATTVAEEMIPKVDLVVLSRTPGDLHPAVERGIRRQDDVDITLHRLVGETGPEDRCRWEAISRARNNGKALGAAPFLMFLDDDVVLESGCVSTLLQNLLRRPIYGALGADYLNEHRTGRIAPHVSMGATLFRRESLDEISFRWREERCECRCCCDDMRRRHWAIDYCPDAKARHLSKDHAAHEATGATGSKERREPSAAHAGMSIGAMMQLIDEGPPGPWPRGWATWANTIEAHRRLAERFIGSLGGRTETYPVERGIVIAGGGAKYFPSVWVNVNLIRRSGCRLPIQLWHLGDEECDPYTRRLLASLGVECVDARRVAREHPCRILNGWELKPYAALHAPFAEVLFLDADNEVVRDVSYLFDEPRYGATGAIFWPDDPGGTLAPGVWRVFGIEHMVRRAARERAFESGQYLIDKRRCGNQLRLALWYAEHSDFVFQYVYGDKECFHLAWRKLRAEYAMPSVGPHFSVHTIVQFDHLGRVLFQHRCGDKWKLAGNRFNGALANEQLCFDLVADLKSKWNGIPWTNPFPLPAEQRSIEVLAGRRFLFRGAGHEERGLTLDRSGLIESGSGQRERRWSINHVDGREILTISEAARPVCHLVQESDGAWRGRWMNNEEIPMELIPADGT